MPCVRDLRLVATVVAMVADGMTVSEILDELHVVVVVDARQHEERIVTVYEPDPDRWDAEYRRRR